MLEWFAANRMLPLGQVEDQLETMAEQIDVMKADIKDATQARDAPARAMAEQIEAMKAEVTTSVTDSKQGFLAAERDADVQAMAAQIKALQTEMAQLKEQMTQIHDVPAVTLWDQVAAQICCSTREVQIVQS